MFDRSATRPFDNESDPAANQPADLAPAFMAFRHRAVSHGLPPFEPQAALTAFVFIGWHRSSHLLFYSFHEHDHIVLVAAQAGLHREPPRGKKGRSRLRGDPADGMLPPLLPVHPGDKPESFR